MFLGLFFDGRTGYGDLAIFVLLVWMAYKLGVF
uniref:Uncharacterized protein n=1 Tax=Podoviridae sp. ctzeq1 TaxID=2826597 RepID=A0A8S5M0F1_9CAUD|nr:MAG TPA: hypothetical protein [Podoviridae sp. ctzeq1]DAF34371.1 MAG TPA: hypothetical protein [Caudoviricetes sp.]DAQ55848.1 MAG TPA: hypothetical protein [Caudoviricetes sp.]DAV87261.1 MAG TPA: hypothetical protein [Caudoviricetes sp.]DAX98006.1 MAG TPA: hypothetical protein [Caudoviricetes sp.]